MECILVTSGFVMLVKHDLTAASFLSFSTTFEHGYTCKQEFT